MSSRQETEREWRAETLAIHGGFVQDATTRAVAMPGYQTFAYAFDSAAHAAALFDLEAEGYRYSPSPLTFGVRSGCDGGCAFYDALRLVRRLVNPDDAKSLVCHPASTTHRQLSAEEQRKAGITAEMIRLRVGIEHFEDIAADPDRALDAASVAAKARR